MYSERQDKIQEKLINDAKAMVLYSQGMILYQMRETQKACELWTPL
jgi:hypothetical protein